MKVATSLVAAAITVVSSAQAQPQFAPPRVPEAARISGRAGSPFPDTLSFGPVAVAFETTRLADVRDRLGAGVIRHQGDAGSSVDWLCYTLMHDGRAERLWLTSGELNRSAGIVDGASLLPAANADEAGTACPAIDAAASVDGKIHVGMAVSELIQVMGRPEAESDGWRVYAYDQPVKVAGRAELFDRQGRLYVHVQAGLVTGLHMSRTTTN
jgi:hypothetical protein